MSKSSKTKIAQLPPETQAKVSDADFFSYAENIGKMAVEIQLKADSQVDRIAGHLLVCITLLSSAFLVPFEWAYNLHSSTNSSNMWSRVVLLYYLILFLILFTALALTIRSILLFKVDLLDSPSKQFSCFQNSFENKHKKGSLARNECSEYHCDALNVYYEALENRNHRMQGPLKRACILTALSMIVAVVGLLAILISCF